MYDTNTGQWVLNEGDLAYWLADENRPVRCRVELVTHERVYLKATADDAPKFRGQVWFEARYSRRVAPREAVYVHQGRAHVNWSTVSIRSN